MKLTVFQSADGDCLLVTGRDGTNLLVDGGRRTSFESYAASTLSQLDMLDLVCVSHIDSDHIAGILQLIDDLFDWRVYDYQQFSGNASFPSPRSPRPPEICGVWHNSFKDQLEENSEAIEEQLVANAKVLNMDASVIGEGLASLGSIANGLVTSVRESLSLANRLSAGELGIPVNREFGGKAIFLDSQPLSFPLGDMRLYLLGPFKADLEKQRDDWNTWLKSNQDAVDELRREAEQDAEMMPISEGDMVLSYMRSLATALGERDKVTPPNLASIMLLAEEDGKRLLLTGDGHADDIIKGFKLHGLLDEQDRLHVDVIKVQHHGAEFNITQAFCETITADDYVFCGDGAHGNPELEVLQTLIDSRLSLQDGPAAGRPFKLWFSASSQNAATDSRKEHMRQVEKLVRSTARSSNGRIDSHFLTRASHLTLWI
jgi:beta-lactamase superfamily II metal-dependent hydrolase